LRNDGQPVPIEANVSLTGKRIAVLVAEGVEELEYFVPFMRLREERADVFGAGLDLHTVKGKHGLEITPTVKVDALKAADLSGLVIPGGWAPDKLRRSVAVTTLTKDMNTAGKPIGIICHGGLVAISAGIVSGKSVTGSLGIKDDLVNAGGKWVDAPAFVDGNQVWGRVVDDIPDFCRELVEALTTPTPTPEAVPSLR
jgi:protease I